MPRIAIILTLLFLTLFANLAVAQEKDRDIEQLNTKILQLQQQFIEQFGVIPVVGGCCKLFQFFI